MALLGVCALGGLIFRGRSARGSLEHLRLPAVLFGAAAAIGAGVAYKYGASILTSLAPGVGAALLFVYAAAAALWIGDDRSRLARATAFVASLILLRALLSIGLLSLGMGTPLRGGEATLTTSLDAATNLSRTWFVCFVASLAVARATPKGWLRWALWGGACIAALALFLSLRRSFLLGGLVALAVIFLVSSRRRPSVFVVAVSFLLAVVLLAQFGGLASVGAEFGDRTAGDAYRTVERANAWLVVKGSPIEGIGAGVAVPHEIFYESIEGAESYVHVAVLWHWLTFGILGVIAYLMTYFRVASSGVRAFFRSRVPLASAVALSTAAVAVAALVGDLSATFTSADPRFSMMLGLLVGLGAASRVTRPQPLTPEGDQAPQHMSRSRH